MKRKQPAMPKARDVSYPDARPFDAAEYLVSDAQIAAYLDAALEEGDPAFFQEALGTVARARGMADVAERASSTRAGLYKALKADGNPEFGTVQRVVNALGYRLQVVAVKKAGSKAKQVASVTPVRKRASR